MGCENSKPKSAGGELYNKDVSVKRRFQSGIHISKGPDGLEGGVQLGFVTAKKKVYEKLPPTITEQQQHAIEE